MSIQIAKSNRSDKSKMVGKQAEPEPFVAPAKHAFDFRHKKNKMALKDLTTVNLRQIVEENPAMSLKDVLSEIVKGYPKEIPADVLLEMTDFVLNQWSNLNIRHQQAA